jgi:threonine synthase
MDIQVSSNFERYLFDLLRRDSNELNKMMGELKTKKSFQVSPDLLQQTRREFSAERSTDPETLQMMRECYEHTGVLIDPHSAVGLHATLQSQEDPTIPVVTVATAHPSKFPDAVEQATGIRPALPPHLADLMDRAEYLIGMPNDLAKITAFIRSEAPKA